MIHLRSAWLICAMLFTSLPAWAVDTLPAGSMITLEEAIQKALKTSPRLKAYEAGRLASEGERQQAGLWTNPEIGIEAENFAGSGPYSSFNSAEVTYGVSQQIEMGGKRGARVEAANQAVTLAGFDQEAARLDLIHDVTLAYVEAVAAQEAVVLTQEQQTLAGDVLETVSSRVNAAREPLIQKSKAEVTMATSRIAYETAQRQLGTAKRFLAALWGESTDVYTLDGSAFFNITEPKRFDPASDSWKSIPDFARWEAEIARSKAAHQLEKANAIPDPSIEAGVRDFQESGDQAFIVGVSLPIPILNQNQGNITKARQEIIRAESKRDDVALTLSARLNEAQQEFETSYHQAVALHQTILPSAEEAFKLSREGYGLGKFSYLEVLDAQRTLNETRAQYHETLKDYHRSRAEVERLTATRPAAEGDTHVKN